MNNDDNMAATREVSKELKSLLKSARSALDKEDHREAIKQCQVRILTVVHNVVMTGSFLAG